MVLFGVIGSDPYSIVVMIDGVMYNALADFWDSLRIQNVHRRHHLIERTMVSFECRLNDLR